MSAEGGIPSPWGQAYPRAVLLAPDGFLVPCGTLKALLKKGGRLEVIVKGFARQGYRVTGFDFLPEMVRGAERNASAA